MAESQTSAPYTKLAKGYDLVMAHVDYPMWAEYIFALLQRHHPGGHDILELGCGTGSLALELQQLGGYGYHATDLSEEMLSVADKKAENERVPILISPMDFRAVPSGLQYDAILLLYDGINYITEPTEVISIFQGVFGALRPGGLFIFDQSTPANSVNNSDGFDDAGSVGDFRYLRTSQYDEESRLHTTRFRLDHDGAIHTETHIQRSYGLEEMVSLIGASPLNLEASYDGFTFDRPDNSSERIHHVLRGSPRG